MGGKWGLLHLKLWKLRNDLYILYLALRHPNTPFKIKAAILAMAVYVVSPVDLIPGVVPFAGMIDDFLVMTLTMLATSKMLPEGILKDCRKEAESVPVGLKIKKVLVVFGAIVLAVSFLIWLFFFKSGAN